MVVTSANTVSLPILFVIAYSRSCTVQVVDRWVSCVYHESMTIVTIVMAMSSTIAVFMVERIVFSWTENGRDKIERLATSSEKT